MKRTLPILTLAALLFASVSPTAAAPPETGIAVRAALYISYGTPAEVAPGVWVGVGDVMMPVAASFTVLQAHSGHEVGRFTSDASGAFTVAVPPGKYVVVPDPFMISALPLSVSIPSAAFEVTVVARNFTPALMLYFHDGPISVVSAISD